MRKWTIGILGVLVVAGSIFWTTVDDDMRGLILNMPTNKDVLFWSVSQRDAAFRAMDRMPILTKSRVIPCGEQIYPLPKGELLEIGTDVDAYMKDQRTAVLVIVHEGKVRLEKYGLDFSPGKRWTSFSVAKSFTSTLVGAAIKDGYIKNIDDKVSDYIPDLRGSAYDDVTIKQLLTMTSGVKWNEDYGDPKSDVALFNAHKAEPGVDVTVSYMRKLKREVSRHQMGLQNRRNQSDRGSGKFGDREEIVRLIRRRRSGDLLAWRWMQAGCWGRTGHEISGCCIQASTLDFARFGLFMLGGGIADGKPVLPDGWIAEATMKQADTDRPEYGYGYQWWTWDDGTYMARGIFGQGIFIDPKRKLVIASNSDWPQATDRQGGDQGKRRSAFYKQVQLAIDREAKP